MDTLLMLSKLLKTFKFLSLSILITCLLLVFASLFSISNLVIASILAYIFAFFIFIPVAYFYAIEKIQLIYVLKEEGVLYKIFSKRIILYTFLHLSSIPISWYILAQLRFFNILEWTITFFSIFLFFLLYERARNFVSKEAEPFIRDYISLKMTAPSIIIFSSLIYTLIFIQNNNILSFDPLLDKIIPKEWTFSQSALLVSLFDFVSASNYIEKSAFVFLNNFPELKYILFFISKVIMFSSIFSSSYFFLLKKNEIRRIITLERTEKTRSLSKGEIFSISFIITFVSIFIYIYSVATIESNLRNLLENNLAQHKNENVGYIVAEQIGDKIYKLGTIEEVEKQKQILLKEEAQSLWKKIQHTAEESFSEMEKNVDLFLDWYYSIQGEYLRIFFLLLGNAEEYIEEKMIETLLKNDPFEKFNHYIEDSDSVIENNVKNVLGKEIKEILAKNEIKPENIKNKMVFIKRKTSLKDLKFISKEDLEKFNFIKERLAGAATGSLTGSVAGYVIAKKISAVIAKKGIAKKLASLIIKKVGNKIIIQTIFIAIGSAAGSVASKIGTIVGGITGAVISGLVIDMFFIEVDEAMHREEFKKEIIDSIRKAKEEFMKNLETDQNI